MSKNNVRIAIRDSTDSHNVAFFDNKAGIKYKSANLHRFLAGSASILTIKYNSKDIDSIRSGCKLAFRYKNRDYWLNVMSFEKKGFEVELTAYSLGLELNNETRGEHKPANAMSIAEYVAYYDPEHALTIGVNEVSDKRIKLEWTGTDTILARLFSVANSFGAELDFNVELNDDYSLKRQVLNIYKKGNLGTNKVSQPVRVGKELKVINYSDNIKELRTAVRATGKDGLTIDGLNKTIYDNNKELLYYSSGMTVYAPQSRDRFPSVGKGSNDNWIVKDLGETQYETKEALWGYMYGEIQKISVPEITYEVEGAIEAGIGDTQTLIDDIHFEPALYVQARVSELEDDILTGKVTNSTFINFERKYSQIADSLLKQVEALAEEAAPYIVRLSTDNGYNFKNGQGTSTITARLEKYSKDIAATWKWVVDNKVVGTGDKLTVKAEQVTNTMAVTVIAYVNGNEVVRDYMTFSNSDDGVGVESIDRYFTSSDQSDGVTIEGAEWSDKPPAPTEDGKYLWAYDEITYTDGTVTTTKPAAVGANFDVDAFRAEIAEDLKDVPNREEFENKIAEELANSKAEIETQIETAKTQAESNAKEYADEINQATAEVAEQANTAANSLKSDLAKVKTDLTTTTSTANAAKTSASEAKQQLTAVANDLSKAKTDLQNAVSAVDTKATNLQSDVSNLNTSLSNTAKALQTQGTTLANQAKELQTQASQLTDQAKAQETLTTRVENVETTANGTKTTVSELSKTVTQNGKDITSVSNRTKTVETSLTSAKTSISELQTSVSTAKTDLTNLTKRTKTVEDGLTGTKTNLSELTQTVSNDGKTIASLTSRTKTVEDSVSGLKTTMSSVQKDLTAVTTRTKTVEDDLSGTKTTLSQVQTTANSASQKTATLETGLNGLTAKFDNLKIGGTNLLLYSGDPWKAPNDYYQNVGAIKTDETLNGSIVYKTRSAWASLRSNWGKHLIDRNSVKVGDEFTYSVYVRTDQETPIKARLFFRYSGQSNAEDMTGEKLITQEWQRFTKTFTVTQKMLSDSSKLNWVGFEQTSNSEDGKFVYYACNKLERGNIATDYSPNEADLEQKVSEYKQTADQNYASLQTTVQALDGTVTANKATADQTAEGFKTRIESLETYKSGESTRANQYFESAKTETARQLTAERTAIAKDYVAKSTYTSDVTGIRNDLTATTTTANTTKTNLANYQASNDKAVANLQSNLQTANGNISSLKTKVEAVPGQITSAVSAVEGKIPKSVGAVNLFKGSRDFSGTSWVNNNSSLYTEDYQGVKIFKKNSMWGGLSQYFEVKTGEEYVFSGYVKSSAKTDNVTFYLVHKSKQPMATGLVSFDSANTQDLVNFDLTDKYKRIAIKIKITKDGWIMPRLERYNNDAYLFFGGYKLERGNIATDYSPNPEDYDSKLATAQSEFKQTTDAIKASVSSLDSSTVKSASLTINTDGIVMKAGKSTTDVANAIGSYFAVNQNAINLFADKIKVKGDMIVDGAITSNKIASQSINTAHLNGKIITADVIATGAITANAIKAGAVTTDKMTANSINGDRITAGTLDAAKIKAGSITASQIASGTITSAQIKTGTISAANIAVGAITTDKIAANSINSSKIVSSGITANVIKGGKLQSLSNATNFELDTGKLFYNNNNTGIFRVQANASTMGLKFSNTSITVSGTSRILSRVILGGDRRETSLDDGKWDQGGFTGIVAETINGVDSNAHSQADTLRVIGDNIYFTHSYNYDAQTKTSAQGWKMETFSPFSSYAGNVVLKPYGINYRQSDIITGDVRLDNGDGSGYWVRECIRTLRNCFQHYLNGGTTSGAMNAIRDALKEISGV